MTNDVLLCDRAAAGAYRAWLRGAMPPGLPRPYSRVARPVAATKAAQARGRARVAVLPMLGVLDAHRGPWLEALGGTATVEFGRAIDEALADPTVKAVVLDVESPGGSVFGTPELAAKIRSARGTKPIVAVANAYAASAAYWIASAADKLYVTPSGQVGSVGAYLVREDATALYAAAGLDLHVISAGKYKAEGLPYVAFTEGERADLQSYIGEVYDHFIGDVARHRGTTALRVRTSYGEGRMLSARRAAAAGMVDGVHNFEDVLSALSREPTVAGVEAALVQADIDRWLKLEAAAPQPVAIPKPAPSSARPTLAVVEGRAVLFNVESRQKWDEIDGHHSTIWRPGCFSQTLASGREIILTVDHEYERPIASTRDGTLRVWEDEDGLRFEASLPATAAGREALEMVRAGGCGASPSYEGDAGTFRVCRGRFASVIIRESGAQVFEIGLTKTPVNYATWARVKPRV